MAPIPPSSADQDDVCPHASRFTAPSLRRSGKEGTFRLDSPRAALCWGRGVAKSI